MIIKQKSYGYLEIDNRETDHVQMWCNEGKDPQVIHIERDNLNKFVIALMNTAIDSKLLLQQRYIKDNCHKTEQQLADDLDMPKHQFRKLMLYSGLTLTELRKEREKIKNGRKKPLIITRP